MSPGRLFAAVGLAAVAAGAALWLATRPARIEAPGAPAAHVSPAALYAAGFRDLRGEPQSLGQFQGRILVLNFWATWCAPCREEMPAFDRVHRRWQSRGVAFVGVSAEPPEKVERFRRDVPVGYALWVGGDEVGELSRRLGNRLGVLPHTVIFGPAGEVLDMKVGPYTEAELEARLAAFSSKSS